MSDANPSPVDSLPETDAPLVRSFDQTESDMSPKRSLRTAVIISLIIVAGIISGWGIAQATTTGLTTASGGLKSSENVAVAGVKTGDVVGVADEKSFRDNAEGVLVDGGIDGEGSHHIVRPGGPSQNVYLTSSIVDLNLFVNHKVKVWGETFSAQKAGWLMDVGRVQVLELNSEPPSK